MSHFYGAIKGNRGPATRCGTKRDGLRVSARGWNVGASVECTHQKGADIIYIYADKGSNGGGGKLIATVRNVIGIDKRLRVEIRHHTEDAKLEGVTFLD